MGQLIRKDHKEGTVLKTTMSKRSYKRLEKHRRDTGATIDEVVGQAIDEYMAIHPKSE